jgi:hypothetical protein
MNTHDQYLFDLQGYITIPNALDAEQLRELNAIWDAHIVRDCTPETPNKRWGDLLTWGKPFRDLIDLPTVTPYLEDILGRNFRLDHDYADLIRAGKSPIGSILHGGGTPYDASQYYHVKDGRMYNGLVVVAYNLHDVAPGDGGFGCVPGSHKSNFPFPSEWRDLADFKPFMRAVTGPAGTAIVFTEALTHGAMPWTGAHERRTLFFKYSPFPLSWSAAYYDASEYEGLTDSQRAVLEPPNARYGGRVPKMGRKG